jgi:hypothetical protein
MNGGRFNGDSLTLVQKQLHLFYTDLLTLASTSPALTQGDYVDITNYNIEAGNFGDRIHAFLRFTSDERLLIITSFSAADQNIKVQLSPDAVERLSLDPDGRYIARDLIWKEVEVGFDSNYTFELHSKPYSSFIFKLK